MNDADVAADTVGRHPAFQSSVVEALRQRSQDWIIPPMILLGIADTRLRETVAVGLKELACEIVALGDGYHVVECMADAILDGPRQSRPCLIIVDSILPGCTGLSVLAGLREMGWDTPVILLMPHEDEDVRRQAWGHGATGVFMNPFEVQELCVYADLVRDASVGTRVPSSQSSRREWLADAEFSAEDASSVRFSEAGALGGARANG